MQSSRSRFFSLLALPGLDWAHGAVSTQHGLIQISIDKQKGTTLDLPAGIEQARFAIPNQASEVLVNGTAAKRTGGYIILTSPGRYEITVRSPPR